MASCGASPGALDPLKSLIVLRLFNVFDIGPSWLQLRLSCPMLGHLGLMLVPLGTILGPSWALLGPSWALLGPPWDHPGGLLGLLGAILGPHGGPLGPSWGHLGSWRSHLGPPWGSLGPLVDHLGAILDQHVPISGQFGPLRGYLKAFWASSWSILGPCRDTLGSSWGHVWGILCYIGLIFRSFCVVLTYSYILASLAYRSINKHLASRTQILVRPRRGREALTIRRPVT